MTIGRYPSILDAELNVECFKCPSCGHWQYMEDCTDQADYYTDQVPDGVDSPLDCEKCGGIFDECDLDIVSVATHQAIVNEFLEYILPSVKRQYERDGVPDPPARREAWNNWTDSLCKDGCITPRQYEEWDQPDECGAAVCPRCQGEGVCR